MNSFSGHRWLCVAVCAVLAAGCGGEGGEVDDSGVVDEGVVLGGDSGDGGTGEAAVVVSLLDSAGCSDGRWVVNPGVNVGLVSDCEALVGFRNRLAGGRWFSGVWSGFAAGGGVEEEKVEVEAVWGVGEVGEWEGVDVNGEGRVVELDLSLGDELKFVPNEVVDLSELRRLDLSSSGFSGELPEGFGGLSKLEGLFLRRNSFTKIPSAVFGLANLEDLDFRRNRIESIPSEIGALGSLVSLDLADNALRGSIPAEIWKLTNLAELDLSDSADSDEVDNQLSGTIPAEIGNLAELSRLDLSGNLLSGTIPAEIGNLAELSVLDLGGNLLSGSVPAELGNLSGLLDLSLERNDLSGSIPAELSNTELEFLYLFDNDISGRIPTGFADLEYLAIVDISGNNLSGPVPPRFADLEYLLELDVSDNDLCGVIPEGLYEIRYFLHDGNPELGQPC